MKTRTTVGHNLLLRLPKRTHSSAIMSKQARRRQRAPPQGPPSSLLDLWRGDSSEVIPAFLPLKAIATMPVSRRFRDRHPAILFSVARRHGALAAGTGAFLDAVVATGREWRRFSSDAVDYDTWAALRARRPNPRHDDFTCTTNTSGGVRHIQISTAVTTGHGGGLARRFNPADRLCLRRVKYRFSFTDGGRGGDHPLPDFHAGDHPELHGLAYFTCGSQAGFDGLYVRPTSTGYMLQAFNDSDWSNEAGAYIGLSPVEPDTWYDVVMTYEWTRRGEGYRDLSVDVAVKGEDGRRNRRRFICERELLSAVKLHNSSPGVARFAAIEVQYPEKNSRDGRFAEDTVGADSE